MVKLKSILAAAAVAIALAFQSGAASAQAQIPFPGADGYTRVMWRGTDGSISLWKATAGRMPWDRTLTGLMRAGRR
jgi:hypothetical protein